MPLLKQYYFTPGEILNNEDEYDPGNSNALYLVTEGNVEVLYANI